MMLVAPVIKARCQREAGDTTKAFDRICYCRLFSMLIDREIPPCIILVLLGFYVNSMIRIAWNGIFSNYFLAVSSVREGGVLSPVIFSVFIDGLLVRLVKAQVGCHIGTYTVCTLHRDTHQFAISGKAIEFVDTIVHLGHVIRSDMDDSGNIENQHGKFIGKTNSVLCYFGKLVSDVKYRLFSSNCSSMYGSVMWYVGDKCVNKLCIEWS